MTELDEKQKGCTHGVTFDLEAAKVILAQPSKSHGDEPGLDFIMGHSGSSEVKRRWPRGFFTPERPCPLCGYDKGVVYASYEHYTLGDW